VMKRFYLLVFFSAVLLLLSGVNSFAQIQNSSDDMNNNVTDLSSQIVLQQYAMPNPLEDFTVNVEKPQTGKELLITGGCLSLLGVALYGASWTMVGDAGSLGTVCSITGLSCVAISIPFYVTGGIKHSRYRKSLHKKAELMY